MGHTFCWTLPTFVTLTSTDRQFLLLLFPKHHSEIVASIPYPQATPASKVATMESWLILIAQKMPLHTSFSHWGLLLPIFPIKDAVLLILRSNPALKSPETKCDINHISRLGHIWESDKIIWTRGGSERQSSHGRRIASFDLTASIFQWTQDVFDSVWHRALGARLVSYIDEARFDNRIRSCCVGGGAVDTQGGFCCEADWLSYFISVWSVLF